MRNAAFFITPMRIVPLIVRLADLMMLVADAYPIFVVVLGDWSPLIFAWKHHGGLFEQVLGFLEIKKCSSKTFYIILAVFMVNAIARIRPMESFLLGRAYECKCDFSNHAIIFAIGIFCFLNFDANKILTRVKANELLSQPFSRSFTSRLADLRTHSFSKSIKEFDRRNPLFIINY